MDLLLTNASELIGDITIGDCQDCTDDAVHTLEEYWTYEEENQEAYFQESQIPTLQGGWSTKPPGNLSSRTRKRELDQMAFKHLSLRKYFCDSMKSVTSFNAAAKGNTTAVGLEGVGENSQD